MPGYDLTPERKIDTYVKITEDKMSAWLYLAEPENTDYKKEDILALLKEEGVSYGLNRSNIAAMAKKKVYEREIKVAEGLPALEGKGGSFEFFIDVEGTPKKPKIKEDGSVDYASMSAVQQVEKGAVIAVYHPAVVGQSGYNVLGKEIKPAPVRDLPALKGKGFQISPEDPNVYLASAVGKVEYRDGKLDIKDVYSINGDVSFITEKIEFYGDVVINGNVGTGINIRAGKSLTINGTVEAVQIYAGGDVVLKRGIQGGGKAKIVTRGNVYADFIEHTIIETKGNVRANIILNSQVFADGDVVLTGKKGAIIGGYVHGLKGVEAAEMGNPAEVKTVVHAGCLPELIQKWHLIGREENSIKKQYLDAGKELENLMKFKEQRKIPQMVQDKLDQLIAAKAELQQAMMQLEEEKTPLMELIKQGKDAVVRVTEHIYRDTVIEIDSNRQVIENSTCYMEYTNISGVLTGSVMIRD